MADRCGHHAGLHIQRSDFHPNAFLEQETVLRPAMQPHSYKALEGRGRFCGRGDHILAGCTGIILGDLQQRPE